MKNRNYITIIVLIFSISLLSCTKEKINTKTESKKQTPVENTSKSDIDRRNENTSKINKYNNYSVNIDISGKAIKAEKLKDYLPNSIAGTEKSKPSTGTIFGEKFDVTTASYSYSYKNGAIVIQISDYGNFSNIPQYDKKYFEQAPTIEGMEIETVMDNTGKGYIIWDEEKNSGSMYYILANRFIIKLEGYSLPSGSGGITSYFNLINRDLIIQNTKR